MTANGTIYQRANAQAQEGRAQTKILGGSGPVTIRLEWPMYTITIKVGEGGEDQVGEGGEQKVGES